MKERPNKNIVGNAYPISSTDLSGVASLQQWQQYYTKPASPGPGGGGGGPAPGPGTTRPIQYLVVAGGGAGGPGATSDNALCEAGGGGGGFLSGTMTQPWPSGTVFTVAVGGGGTTPGVGAYGIQGPNGGNSSISCPIMFRTVEAVGGATAGNGSATPLQQGNGRTQPTGGSGAGQKNAPQRVLGASGGWGPQGNRGGVTIRPQGLGSGSGGGGGGGAGGDGGTGVRAIVGGANGGAGGSGAQDPITGNWYSGGGGGGSAASYQPAFPAWSRIGSMAAGGIGGGGAGGYGGNGTAPALPNQALLAGQAGQTNTGGGGGGSGRNGQSSPLIPTIYNPGGPGGAGGSGIVIVQWSTAYPAASATTGSPTYNGGAGGVHRYTFTGSGSFTL